MCNPGFPTYLFYSLCLTLLSTNYCSKQWFKPISTSSILKLNSNNQISPLHTLLTLYTLKVQSIPPFVISPHSHNYILLSLWVCFCSINKFICVFSFLLSTQYHICLSLTSLSMIISMSIHIGASGIISIFLMAEEYSTVYMYHIFFVVVVSHMVIYMFQCHSPKHVPHLYPLICQWIFRLLPCPGYRKQCYNEHWGTWLLSNHVFLWIYPQEWDCWITW